jgi:hypothetical protein
MPFQVLGRNQEQGGGEGVRLHGCARPGPGGHDRPDRRPGGAVQDMVEAVSPGPPVRRRSTEGAGSQRHGSYRLAGVIRMLQGHLHRLLPAVQQVAAGVNEEVRNPVAPELFGHEVHELPLAGRANVQHHGGSGAH